MTEREEVLRALRDVVDPELGIDVVSLGLVYDVAIDGPRVHVDMTMTSPTCPLGDVIVADAEAAIRRAAPDAQVDVRLVWDPPWTPRRMSDEAKQHFGWETA